MASPLGARRHLTLLVSGGLVLLIGALGLFAGHSAGAQARDVHRVSQVKLQATLAGLVDRYTQIGAQDVLDALGGRPGQGGTTFSAVPGDPDTVSRLEQLVATSRTLDVGAVLVSGTGAPLAAWTATGDRPAPADPAWEPLRAAVQRGDGSLPLSDLLPLGSTHVLAMALPVALDDGSTGLVLGLHDPAVGALQAYLAEVDRGNTGAGYVVDGAGRVIASSRRGDVGELLPLSVRDQVRGVAGSGVLDSVEGGTAHVTTWSATGTTGWTTLSTQTAAEFEGALRRSSLLAQGAVVLLLLAAGTGLTVLSRKREAALRAVALHDELTGIYNRRGWFALAAHELERAKRQGTERVLLFVDLDGLKQVNDVLGHREGDRAIQDAARVLTSSSRASDLVGRLGGDEFVLLLGEDGRADVALRRVREAVAAHNAQSGAGFELRLSVGAEVWFPDAACSLDELVRRADACMYQDKTARPERAQGILRLPEPRSADEPARAAS